MSTESLPLTPRVLLILWALESGPQHGYRLLQELEERGRGRVSIGPASLYEAIQTLQRRDWIAPVDAPDDADSRRRYFRLTDHGRSVLRAEAQRLADLVNDLRVDGLVDSAKV